MSNKRPKKNATGDCFEAAGKLMMDLSWKDGADMRNVRLVHGEVAGQGSLKGTKFGHAWVEKTERFPELSGLTGSSHCNLEMVLDHSNGEEKEMPKAIYYWLGKISDDFGNANTHSYTYDEFVYKTHESGNWGPWDLETETGL